MRRIYLVLIATLLIVIFSCHKGQTVGPVPPKLATAVVTDITDTTAVGGGSFLSPGTLPLLVIGVQLATDSSFSGAAIISAAGTRTAPFTVSLTGLYQGTQYYVRAVASDSNNEFFGNIVNFTTGYTPGLYNVTTLAGSGNPGLNNEPSGSAEFSGPDGAGVDASGNIYIADSRNYAIRIIANYGAINTYATTDGMPFDVVADNQGNLYVAESTVKILKITPGGQVSTLAGSGIRGTADGTGTAASFNSALTLSIDPAGDLYVGDGTAFRKITPAGVVSTLTDYFGATASHAAIAIDNHYNIYETNGVNIIRIDSLGNETLLAGGTQKGHTDGTGAAASFAGLDELRTDVTGNIYATDPVNNNVRMITPAGVATTLAGTGAVGAHDGNSAIATFSSPIGLTPDNSGNIIVCDLGNNIIRKISPL